MKPEYQSILSAGIEKKYRMLEQEIMSDVVRRIQKAGTITSTADWQLQRYMVLGHSTEDVENIIRSAVGGDYVDTFRLYDEVIETEYVRSKAMYEQVNAHFTPYEQNYELQQLTNALIQQSNDELFNISKSLGFMVDMGNGRKVFTPLSEIYNGYLDNAITMMASGAYDYNTLIRKVVGQMTASGLRTVDYASGHSNRVDVAVRRALLTGMGQLTGRISDMNGQKLGTDQFEIDWHPGARPDHAVWQGRVWRKEQLYSVCGLGTGPGLLGWNCRHTYYPFIPGISVRNYSDEWLEAKAREEAEKKPFRGKEYNLYEATQKQRQMETAMRAQREKVKLLQQGKADKDDIINAKCKYQAMLDEYAQFSKKFNLPEQRERIYYDLKGRVAPSASTYNKWKAEQVNKAKERAEKKRRADMRAAWKAASQKAAASGTIKKEPGIPSSWTKGSPMTVQAAAAGTNPNYTQYIKEWTHNCQRCVSAFEARMRGYDVEALPRILNGMDELPYMNNKTGWLSVYQNPVVTSIHKNTGKACKDAIEKEMADWGDGARAIVRVRWKSGGGHVFNAVQENGQTIFIDAQSNTMNCQNYFSAGMIKPGMTELVRIDNLDFTDRIELCAKLKGVKQ